MVAPLIASGLHCGVIKALLTQVSGGSPAHRERAPLRLADLRLERGQGGVAPLIASGLHCGTHSRASWGPGGIVAPLIASGLHCGHDWSQNDAWYAAGRPAHRERAPLRHLRRYRNVLPFVGVAPLIASGLHCGLP